MSVRTRTIRAIAGGLYHGGLLRPLMAAASRFRGAGAFTVLTFHRVNDEADPFFPSLATAVFAERVQHIARHYTVLPVEELVDLQQRDRVPRNALAVTFDDGYRDTLTHAAPILARHGMPATVFLATGYISSPAMPWYDLLALALKTTRLESVEIAPRERVALDSPTRRLQALASALRYMKRLPDPERRVALDRLVAELEPSGAERQKRLMLNWDEVHALRGLGFSIGAHTVSHPVLSRLEPDAARAEIHGSKQSIEENLGTPVKAFAYPNGGADDYDRTTSGLVEQAGFTCAVTTRRGLNIPRTPRFELRRGGPWEQHLPTYALKLAWYQLTGI